MSCLGDEGAELEEEEVLIELVAQSYRIYKGMIENNLSDDDINQLPPKYMETEFLGKVKDILYGNAIEPPKQADTGFKTLEDQHKYAKDSVAELTHISSLVKKASEYGLQSEIIWSALYYLKTNPEKSIQEAITFGFYEWIK